MARGKILTGYSYPYVALYNANAGQVSYSNGMDLARGVNVSVDIESSGSDPFFADNVQAESDNQAFNSGSGTATVDGLKQAARKLISGIVTSKQTTIDPNTTVKWDVNDDAQVVPYIGFGFICRYMEDGVTTWTPVILRKVMFETDGLDAATQEQNIDWQTQELPYNIYRDDSAKHDWRWIGPEMTSEADAYAAIKSVLTPAAATTAASSGDGK